MTRIVCSCATENLGIAFRLDVDPACPVHGGVATRELGTGSRTWVDPWSGEPLVNAPEPRDLTCGCGGTADENDHVDGCPNAPEPSCWCEHVDIGVGEVKVAENYDCPRCHPQPAFGAAADTRYEAEGRETDCLAPCGGAACPVHGSYPAETCSPQRVRCALSVHAVCPFHH